MVLNHILCAGVMCGEKLLAENTVRVEWLRTQWHVVLCWISCRVGEYVHAKMLSTSLPLYNASVKQ